MGGYYARHDGETEEVAFAIEDHYKPRFAGDALPRDLCGVAVALADKLETLAGLFGIGQLPSGDKDPFALRRHALGVIRMLIERALRAGHRSAGAAGLQGLRAATWSGSSRVRRCSCASGWSATCWLNSGYSAQEVDAGAGTAAQRWAACRHAGRAAPVCRAARGAALAAANKRVGNILKKSEGVAPVAVKAELFGDAAESALHAALQGVSRRADAAFDAGDLAGSLQALAALEGAGRRLLQQGHGQRRRPGAARQRAWRCWASCTPR